MENKQSTYDTGSEVEGIVFYTDGGNRPSGKYLGWGIHGYSYKDEIPKKGSGNPTHYPSAFGYIPKADKKEGTIKTEVTPIKYYDGYGCSLEFGSNNLAELLAAKMATSKAIELNPKKLLLRSDSEYLIKGSTDWSHSWVKNNWKKQDGSVVPNADYWKDLLKNYQTLRDNNCDIRIEWVKGHSDHVGNICADKLATVGVMASTNKESREQFDISSPEGYWKSNVDKHPFLYLKYLYFVTNKGSNIKGEYYICNQVKDIELHGRRQSDACYSVIQLETPEPIIENIRDYQCEITEDFDHVAIVRLDQLFKSTVYSLIEKYGKNSLVRKFSQNSKQSLDLFTVENEPLTHIQFPVRISQRSIDKMAELKDILTNFKNKTGSDRITTIDITDLFFFKKSIEKKKQVIEKLTLKPEIGTNMDCLPYILNIKGKDKKIILSLGIDLPSRNSLKSMEGSDININLVYWEPNENIVRYAIVIKHNNDWGIWTGFDSNIVFLN